MGKPDGWAKAWGLAAHVEPAGCMSGTCGVRGAQGPQMDYSKQIVPDGYKATNPRAHLQLQTGAVDLSVPRGVPVTQPAANGVIRVAYTWSRGYDSPFTRVSFAVVPYVDRIRMHPVAGSHGFYELEVSPGRHSVTGPDGITVTDVDVWSGYYTDLDYFMGSRQNPEHPTTPSSITRTIMDRTANAVAVKGAHGPLDYSKQIVPQGYGASNPATHTTSFPIRSTDEKGAPHAAERFIGVGFFGIPQGSRVYKGVLQDGRWVPGRDVTMPGQWVGPSWVIYFRESERLSISYQAQVYVIVMPSGTQYAVTADPRNMGPDGIVFVDANPTPKAQTSQFLRENGLLK